MVGMYHTRAGCTLRVGMEKVEENQSRRGLLAGGRGSGKPVVGREDDERLEPPLFLFCHQGIGHNDNRVADLHKVRCRTVHTDTAATALTRNGIRFQACTIGIVHHLHLFTGVDMCRVHEVFINGDTSDVVQVGLGNRYAVDFGFENL